LEPDTYVHFDNFVFTPGATSFTWSQWLEFNGYYFSNPPLSEADGDGIPPLIEYALGGSPHLDDRRILPALELVDGHVTMTVRKARGVSGLEYVVQRNRNLASNGWTTFGTEIMNEDETILVVRCTKSIFEEPASYLRLRVRLE
jgi:hypothetical protein